MPMPTIKMNTDKEIDINIDKETDTNTDKDVDIPVMPKIPIKRFQV
jgi:hypothetical protein